MSSATVSDIRSNLIPCETREQWLTARRRGIGASEAAAILGLSPWRTPLEIYFDKLGLLPEDNRPRLKWGLRFEAAIAEAYTEETGLELAIPPKLVRHPQWPWMLASLDRETVCDRRPVELKNVSRFAANDFGEAGSDRVPEQYFLQCQQQIACVGADRADLAALIGGEDFRIYTIHRNDEIIARLAEAEREFMERIERLDPPLPDFEHPSTAQLLAMIEPEIDSSIDLADEQLSFVDVYEALGREISTLSRQRDEVKARLLHAMGRADRAYLPDGRFLSRKVTQRAGYVVGPTEFVMFRVNQPKKRK